MGKNAAYTDATGRYFVFGHLFDMKEQRDLTAERVEKAARIAFGELPLADAIKTVRGKGERVLAVFSDPDCPYCRRLEAELDKLDNVTLYTFPYPLEGLHPEAKDKSIAVWCAAESRAGLGRLMKSARPRRAANVIIRSNGTSSLASVWAFRERRPCCPPTAACCPVRHPRIASSSGCRSRPMRHQLGCVPVHARAGRLCRHDDRTGWAGGLFLQGAGRHFLRIALRRLCQCRAEQSARATSVTASRQGAESAAPGLTRSAPHSGDPIRSAQKVRRVWLAPWEDDDEVLHDQSYFYLVVDPGRWQIEHSRRKATEGYRPSCRRKSLRLRHPMPANGQSLQMERSNRCRMRPMQCFPSSPGVCASCRPCLAGRGS